MIMGALWSNLYVKPKNWLCGLQTDKVLHCFVSFIIMILMCGVWKNWILIGLSTFLIGLFKEVVIDKLIMKEEIDMDDLWADIFGIGFAFLAMCGMVIIHTLIYG